MLKVIHEKKANWLEIEGRKIAMQDPVENIKIFDRIVVAILDTDGRPDEDPLLSNNVVAFDAEGNLLWRIEPMKVTFTGRDGKEHPHPYFGIEKHPDGTLWAFGAMGSLRPVDLATGRTGKPIRVDK